MLQQNTFKKTDSWFLIFLCYFYLLSLLYAGQILWTHRDHTQLCVLESPLPPVNFWTNNCIFITFGVLVWTLLSLLEVTIIINNANMVAITGARHVMWWRKFLKHTVTPNSAWNTICISPPKGWDNTVKISG
jgi:hypothetical protein